MFYFLIFSTVDPSQSSLWQLGGYLFTYPTSWGAATLLRCKGYKDDMHVHTRVSTCFCSPPRARILVKEK